MHSRSSLRVLAVAGLGLLAIVWSQDAAAAAPAAPSSNSCYRVELDMRPRWISSATSDGSQVVVVDSFGKDGKRLLSYSPSGKATILPTVAGHTDADFYPARIGRKRDGGFILQLANGTTLSLDDSLRFSDHQSLQQGKSGGYRIGSLYQFTVAGDAVVAYGALLTSPESYELGFFRAPLRSAATQELSMLMPFDEGDYYLIGYQYLAAIEDEAYFVRMSKDPAIYHISATGQDVARLAAFPDAFRVRPDFKTRMTGPKTASAHFSELESFRVAAGLYSQGGMLFLLTRTPDQKGGTAWWLYEIDPRSDRLLGQVRLPTSSNHITLAPSETAWYLFERGAVGENQKQETSTMLVLSSSAIDSLSLPSSCPTRR
jgi:hypothetical protein